jgi:hypothetical protein
MISNFFENWHFAFGPLDGIHYFPEDTTYAVLFREIVSINYQNIRIIEALFEKVAILCVGVSLKGPYFWR